MGWKFYGDFLMNSWECSSDEEYPDLIAIVDHLGGNNYLLCHAVNMKNCGHYRTLTDAKKAALMDGLSDAKFAPISAEDGYSQEFINSTL